MEEESHAFVLQVLVVQDVVVFLHQGQPLPTLPLDPFPPPDLLLHPPLHVPETLLQLPDLPRVPHTDEMQLLLHRLRRRLCGVQFRKQFHLFLHHSRV